jgi:hypothetical protein
MSSAGDEVAVFTRWHKNSMNCASREFPDLGPTDTSLSHAGRSGFDSQHWTEFSFHHYVQSGSGTFTVYLVGTTDSFPGTNIGRSVKLATLAFCTALGGNCNCLQCPSSVLVLVEPGGGAWAVVGDWYRP